MRVADCDTCILDIVSIPMIGFLRRRIRYRAVDEYGGDTLST